MRLKSVSAVAVMLAAILTMACNGGRAAEESVMAVFVPGVLEGSPTYELMDVGVRRAAEGSAFTVKTIEGGFDQTSWARQLRVMASENRYKLIVTSNPAMTEIASAVSAQFPRQDFLVLDGSGLVSGNVADLAYDHLDQAFLVGYFAGLVTMSDELSGSNDELKVGMIAGQEYPQMNLEIRPGFEIGLHSVNPDIKLEFRVLGSWNDAEKARELAAGLYADGVDAILTIAGGANQGVVAAAEENNAYVLWFDSESQGIAPGTVLAGAVVRQDKAAEVWTKRWMDGDLVMGEGERVGIVEGYVDFPMNGRDFGRYVPKSMALRMEDILERMKSGALTLQNIDGE